MIILLKKSLSGILHVGVSLCVLYLIYIWKTGMHCQYVALILRNSFASWLLFILHSNYRVTSLIMMIFVSVYVFIFRLQYTSVMLRLLISSADAADDRVRQTYLSLRLPWRSVRIEGWWRTVPRDAFYTNTIVQTGRLINALSGCSAWRLARYCRAGRASLCLSVLPYSPQE